MSRKRPQIRMEAVSQLLAKGATFDLMCSDCSRAIYRVKRSRLRESITGRPIESQDLEPLHEWRKRDGVQLDCPFCFGSVFEVNYGGGFRCYPIEHEHNHMKRLGRNKRYPHDSGIRPGIRIRNSFYADPNDTMFEARAKLLG